jgi:hypothetical protein
MHVKRSLSRRSLARPEGLEPPNPRLRRPLLFQLSYGRDLPSTLLSLAHPPCIVKP